MRYLIILILPFCCLSFRGQTQVDALDRKVSLRYEDVSLEEVLKSISKNYQVHFSYTNNLIPLDKRVSIRVKNQPLRLVLDELFKGANVSYQLVGDQIVLKYEVRKSSQLEESQPEKSRPVYEHLAPLQARKPSVAPIPPADIQSRAADLPYRPTSDNQRHQKWLNQYLLKLQDLFAASTRKDYLPLDSVQRVADSLEVEAAKDDPYWNYAERDFQITFVTPIGSNGTGSLNTVNHFSVNMIAGVAAGLDGVELGGLLNMEKDYVKGAQFSGLGNLVRNKVTGFQAAGLFNVNGGYTRGVQAAGFANVVINDARAVQLAGFANVVVGNNEGTQVAGFANVTNGDVSGPQIAGFANVASGNVHALQLAGFANVASGDVEGGQISPFFNHARRVRGSQLGFLNVADSVSGVSIGFLSLIRHGYKRVEVWGSEALFVNVAFKTGTSHFYNIFALGTQPLRDKFRWAFGYGIGTEQRLSRNLVLNLDAVSYQINENQWWTDKLNLLNQLKLTMGVRLSNRTYFFAGPTVNVQVSQLFDAEKNRYGPELVPWHFYDHTNTNGSTNVRGWVGFNAGFRF